MRVTDLAKRDGWVCWICENAIDPNASNGSQHAASADHVLPRRFGGEDHADNLRLAHRGCNSARGHGLPELDWPTELTVVDNSPLWQSLQRLMKRPGTSESVALFTEAGDASAGASWVVAAATTITGRKWTSYVEQVANMHSVRLEASP